MKVYALFHRVGAGVPIGPIRRPSRLPSIAAADVSRRGGYFSVPRSPPRRSLRRSKGCQTVSGARCKRTWRRGGHRSSMLRHRRLNDSCPHGRNRDTRTTANEPLGSFLPCVVGSAACRCLSVRPWCYFRETRGRIGGATRKALDRPTVETSMGRRCRTLRSGVSVPSYAGSRAPRPAKIWSARASAKSSSRGAWPTSIR